MSCSLLTSDLLLSAAAQCIPPMGGCGCGGGCVCVVGGSAAQPGPTYLAALAAMRAGADRVHVVCAASEAAAAVRGYGPAVTVVHDAAAADDGDAEGQLAACLADCQAVLVGPGLDSSPEAERIAIVAMDIAVSLNRPLVVDGAALDALARNPGLLGGFQRAILTPNWAEFRRLCNAVSATKSAGSAALSTPATLPEADVAKRLVGRLSAALGGVCVLLKGREDAVAAGSDGQVEMCALQGCGRRCSSQGALLSGLALVFAHWCFSAADARAAANAAASGASLAPPPPPPLLRHPGLLAAFAAAALTRRCAAQAFAAHRRATLASDMADQIGAAFCRLFPEADGLLH